MKSEGVDPLAQERGDSIWQSTAYVVSHPTRRVFQLVADAIRGYMVVGDLAPGVSLPTEVKLAEHFGVSRSTVRESLRVLSTQGLIVTSRGRNGGSTVARSSNPELFEIAQADLGLWGSEWDVSPAILIEARALFEVPAAQLAAIRRTDQQLLRLEQILSARPEEQDRTRSFQFHSDFHQTIYDACGNPLLSSLAHPLLVFTRRRYPGLLPPDFAQHAHDEHVAIFDALTASNAPGAAAAMRDHLIKLADRYRDAAKSSVY